MLRTLQPSTLRPRLAIPALGACDLLREMTSSSESEVACKRKICIDVIRDAVRGKWRLRDGITEQDIAYRKKMDAEIRLRMKVPWPASLYRNDSRLYHRFYSATTSCHVSISK